ncbi:hypothetical protein JMA34_05455 [Staphylococcus pseudintermedius]|nr:hypothetical protein [Staphylococcus pseudintermedius]EGQ3410037.1 hypothetical protein [Staphylococcus pseudintermedius]EGQ4165376.1 hypothetical protein [Staphylococcus pseudintermedius]MCE5439613.1 hypothetical protein [Staphylococcus pseudintermedius]MCE5687703.1 hypothetical protein [Staphylococcus pseudintermedius]
MESLKIVLADEADVEFLLDIYIDDFVNLVALQGGESSILKNDIKNTLKIFKEKGDEFFIKQGEENVWIYVKNTDTEKREFYHALLACLAQHVLLKIKKYILS